MRLELPAARQQIMEWTESMVRQEKVLEERYGYQGSPTTLTAAFEAAGLQGTARARAERWGRKLYVVWGTAQPYFAHHRKALETTLAVFEEQEHALQADIIWLGAQVAEWHDGADHLAASLDELLALWVQRAKAMGRAEALRERLKVNEEALARLGSGDTARDLADLRGELEEALAEVSALRATEYYLTSALRDGSAKRHWQAMTPSSSRKRYRIADLVLPEPSIVPKDLSATAGMLVGAALPAALAYSDLPILQEDVSIAAQEQDDALNDLAENLRLLQTATGVGDLPEVQQLRAKQLEYQEQVTSLTANLEGLPATATAQERAALATEIARAKQDQERADKRLAPWRADGAFREWQEETERGLFTQRARVKIARRSEARAITALSETAEKLLRAERESLRALVDGMRQHLRALRKGLSRNQDVRQVTVEAEGQIVWDAVRPDVEALDQARAQLARESTHLDAVLDSAATIRSLAVKAALEAEAGRDDLGENVAPGPLADLAEPAQALFRKLRLGRGLAKEVANNLEARYQEQKEAPPTLRSTLRELVITTCATALYRFRGELQSEEGTDLMLPDDRDLKRLMKRVARATKKRRGPVSRAARKATDQMGDVVVGYPDSPKDRESIRRAELVALLALPLARWTADMVRPTWKGIAGRARDLVRHHSLYRKRDGFALRRNEAFLAGTSVQILVTQRDGARGDDLIVSVGEKRASPTAGQRGDSAKLLMDILRVEHLDEVGPGGVLLRVSREGPASR